MAKLGIEVSENHVSFETLHQQKGRRTYDEKTSVYKRVNQSK